MSFIDDPDFCCQRGSSQLLQPQSRQRGQLHYTFGYQIGARFRPAYYFIIAGNRHILKSQVRANKSLTHENRAAKSLFVSDPESEIFFLIDSEISKLGRFTHFIYCLSTKKDILLNVRVPYNQ